ncbi:hypothetical protein BOX15_Mlig020651g1 [Macrostomum lignano]|uniref:Phorbol-ester/DAG-type domain-containing protein n=1 Tax=Macrostomum lignano TaxID=282301 RepID=A0A267DKY9_9PLAT|nr:hypothetical protein BOX15_Mlig020651g1 [Macrostomum lignano]
MLVFLHCLLARGAESGQPGSSLWPVYFDWLAEDWSGATGCTKPKHSRRYAYEIYSTFLHEESPLSLLASNSDADASRQQLHDEAVHPLERLFGIGASTGADPASTVRQAQPLINRAQALMAPTLARLATGALADLQQKRRDGFLSDLLPALPGGSTPEQRRLFAARCRPGLLARLRMLRQSESAPAAAEASCLATLLVRGLDPELAESLAPGESPMLFGCQHRSVGRQKSLLSRMGRAAASAASASSGSGAAPDERLRVGAHALEPCALTKAQVCAACDQVLCGAAPQGLQCTADCEQVVHRSCAQQLSSAPCTKRAAARAKDASIGSVKASKSFGGSSNRRRLRHQRHPSSQASTPPAMPRQRFAGGRIDEVEDWMLSGRQVQRNIPDCADDLPILKLTSSRSDQAVSQLAAETFRAARIAPSLHHRANSIADSAASPTEPDQPQHQQQPSGDASDSGGGGGGGDGGGGFNKRASIGRSQSVKTPGSPRVPEFQPDKKPAKVGDGGAEREASEDEKLRSAQSEINISQSPESDDAASHPDIAGVPTDFDEYIVAEGVNKQLCAAGEQQPRPPDFDRYKDYQLALHELVFACASHLRALTVLQLLFVQRWPRSCLPMLRQLGLHFVPECVSLYRSLLASVGQPSREEFRDTGRIACLGKRLLNWYSDERNVAEFRRLSLSFGFSKTASKQQQRRGASAAAGHEDDLIVRLDCLRRDCPELAQFFHRTEAHELMRRRSFKDFYSVNMQHTMRMATLLDTAVRRAKKAKNSCEFAETDAADLEKCLEKARSIIEYSNTIGVKLKELSRQLVLSRTFESFWERCRLDAALVERVQNQVSHLHTCQLHATREVVMRGFENSRLRLLVFTDFLLVISETEESKGVVKYQLLRHLGQSTSVGGQGGETADKGNLRSVSCPPIIPVQNVVHTFEGRQTKSGAAPEFRLVIDNPTIDARLAGGFRAEPMLVEFALSRDKPRHPFMDQEADISAHQLLNCIRQLLQPKTPAKTPTTPLPSGASSASAGGGSRGGSSGLSQPVGGSSSGEQEPSPLGLSSVSSSDAAFESPGGNVGDSSGGAFDDDQPDSGQPLGEDRENGVPDDAEGGPAGAAAPEAGAPESLVCGAEAES